MQRLLHMSTSCINREEEQKPNGGNQKWTYSRQTTQFKIFLGTNCKVPTFLALLYMVNPSPSTINKRTLIAKRVCPFHLLDICLSNFVNLRTTVWHNIFLPLLQLTTTHGELTERIALQCCMCDKFFEVLVNYLL